MVITFNHWNIGYTVANQMVLFLHSPACLVLGHAVRLICQDYDFFLIPMLVFWHCWHSIKAFHDLDFRSWQIVTWNGTDSRLSSFWSSGHCSCLDLADFPILIEISEQYLLMYSIMHGFWCSRRLTETGCSLKRFPVSTVWVVVNSLLTYRIIRL